MLPGESRAAPSATVCIIFSNKMRPGSYVPSLGTGCIDTQLWESRERDFHSFPSASTPVFNPGVMWEGEGQAAHAPREKSSATKLLLSPT